MKLVVAYDGKDVFISDGVNSVYGRFTENGFIDAVSNKLPLAVNVVTAVMPEVRRFIGDTPITEQDIEDGGIDTVVEVDLQGGSR